MMGAMKDLVIGRAMRPHERPARLSRHGRSAPHERRHEGRQRRWQHVAPRSIARAASPRACSASRRRKKSRTCARRSKRSKIRSPCSTRGAARTTPRAERTAARERPPGFAAMQVVRGESTSRRRGVTIRYNYTYASQVPRCAPDSMREYTFELILISSSDTMVRPALLCGRVGLEHTNEHRSRASRSASFLLLDARRRVARRRRAGRARR